MTTQISTMRASQTGDRKSTAKRLMGVSLLVLTLAACAGDETAGNAQGDGWWGWADPDAWYEGEGGQAQRASTNVEGRDVPPSRLPREQAYASAEAGLGADNANAAYADDDVRGSRSGTVQGGASRGTLDRDLTAPQPTEPVASADLGAEGRPLTGSGGATSLLDNYGPRSGSAETDKLVSAADQMAQDFPSPRFEEDLSGTQPSRAMQPNLLAGLSSPQSPAMPPRSAVSGRGPSGSFDDSFETLTGRSVDSLPQRATRPSQPVVPPSMVTAIDQELSAPNMRYSDLQFDSGPRPAPAPMMQQRAYQPAPQAPSGMFAAASQQIPFLAGSVRLSRSDRKKVLAAAIKQKNEGGRIVVVGYSASPQVDAHGAINGYQLAMERANKVALALINAGVPANMIAVEGRADMNMRKADIFVN